MATDPYTDAILQRIDEAPAVRVVRIKVTSTSPFQVLVAGQGPYPGLQVAGQTFAVDDIGFALWAPSTLPICFKAT